MIIPAHSGVRTFSQCIQERLSRPLKRPQGLALIISKEYNIFANNCNEYYETNERLFVHFTLNLDKSNAIQDIRKVKK